MADDYWSAKTYSIQFQAKEPSNQPNCVVKVTRSLALSLSLTHLTSIQRNVNATQLNQSFNQIIHLFTNILI